MIINFFILLVLFQIKHLLADYYLQIPSMYENKGQKTGWFIPLLEHSLVHAGFTLGILALFIYFTFPNIHTVQTITILVGATLLDLISHFITDRWKAVKRRSPNESKFWIELGIDQMIHHLIGIVIVTGTIAIGYGLIIIL